MDNQNRVDIEKFIIPIALIIVALSLGFIFMKKDKLSSTTIIEPSMTIPEYKTPELVKCHNDEGIEIQCKG